MINKIAIHLDTLEAVISTEVQDTKIITIVSIKDENFTLKIDFGGSFPIELPEIYLLDASSYGLLPHVCWQGKVCYNDGEGVSSDTEQLEAIAEYALTKAIETLSIEKDKRNELFFNEFEGYWNRQNMSKTAYSFFEPNNKLQIIKATVTNNKIPIAFLPDNNSTEHEYHFYNICKSKKTLLNAIYLPLEKNVKPPLPGASIHIDFLTEMLEALSTSNKILWDALVSKKKLPKNTLHLLISQPRPQGGNSLYGVTIPFGLNWLNMKIKSYPHKIIPLIIKRHTPDYLLQRSGSLTNILDKNIAIIGCGSLGSRVAELLIMSGIKRLTLIDNDIFSTDNLFKHILGSQYIGQKKVVAIAKQLKSRFPYISITTQIKKVTELSDDLVNNNVIIDTSGNPTLGRVLNAQHRNISGGNIPLFVTAWIEPLGLGGHTIVSDGKTNGCLHCLFHRDNTKQLSSIFNFVKENQLVSRNLTGCGGAFTPFSTIDAVKTAELVTRMTIESLTSMDPNLSKYQWWRGSNEAAIKNNIKTTPWYLECEYSVENRIKSIFEEGCPICRKK